MGHPFLVLAWASREREKGAFSPLIDVSTGIIRGLNVKKRNGGRATLWWSPSPSSVSYWGLVFFLNRYQGGYYPQQHWSLCALDTSRADPVGRGTKIKTRPLDVYKYTEKQEKEGGNEERKDRTTITSPSPNGSLNCRAKLASRDWEGSRVGIGADRIVLRARASRRED